jgi:hypothetical protein
MLNDTLSKQADLVESLLAKGTASGGATILNKPIQALRAALSDPDRAALNTALTGMAREHQRVLTSPMSNAQLHVAAQQTADRLVNENMTPTEIRSVIQVMRTEAKNGYKAGVDTLETIRNQMRNLGRGTGPAAGAPAAPAAASGDDALINKWLKK